MSLQREGCIKTLLGFNERHVPFIYLGYPIFKAKSKEIHLQPLAHKNIGKLTS